MQSNSYFIETSLKTPAKYLSTAGFDTYLSLESL
jgi:hypothetical protein